MSKKITIVLTGVFLLLSSLFTALLPSSTANAAGTTLIIHYGGRADNNYDGWNMWIWEEGRDGQSVAFTSSDDFGQIAIYQCKSDAAKIGFIVRLNEWEAKDVSEDRFVEVTDNVMEIWVTSEVAEFTTTPPDGATVYDFAALEEERLAVYNREDALKLNVHYYAFSENYDAESTEAYAWLSDDAGGSYPLTETDDFGAVFHVGLLPEAGQTAGIKIYQNGTSDCIRSRDIDLGRAKDNVLDIYLAEGNPTVWYSAEEVSYSPVIVDAAFASDSSKKILFSLSRPIDTADTTEGSKFTVTDEAGISYPIVKVWSENPKVEASAYLIMKEPLDLTKKYYIEREGYDGTAVSIRDVIGSADFDAAFAYDGNDLGAVYTPESTVFRMWAPTASAVTLNLYEKGDGDNLIESLPMESDVKGTWVYEKTGDLNGVYYTYSVTVNGVTKEAVDLYAKTTGVNGNRGMVIDLDATDPEGFADDKRPAFVSPTDAVIYELHVRDLSSDKSSGIENTGKFLGLTETGTTNSDGLPTGLDHIKDLGVTHVQLLPVYDYATVDESKPDSGQFNWGYDPKNYNVPEGSYSTDPYNGEVRVQEFKELVQTLHENDIRVVMDVVFNHTYSLEESNFQKTVPDYFYRRNGDSYSNASGCGNETASERAMMRKYMIDSVVYWATEYHIDGFRFDLMAIHDRDTMNAIREALNEVDPSIIIYGEGWTSGDSPLAESERALKRSNYLLNGVGAFSDDIRDSLKGNVFNDLDTGFINGKPGMEESVKISVVGCTENEQTDYTNHNQASAFWSGSPSQTINYLSCHDNLALWDKLAIANAADSTEDRIKMNKLGSAIVFTSQGIPFLQAGEEMLRSKPSATTEGGFDSNSYCSPDSTNSIKWDNKGNVSDVYEYYKGLIAFRKAHGALRMPVTEQVQEHLTFLDDMPKNVVAYTITGSPNGESAETLFVVYNANKEEVSIALPEGSWDIFVNGEKAGTEVLGTAENTVTVAGISAMVLTQGSAMAASTDASPRSFSALPAVIFSSLAALVFVIGTVLFFKNRKKNKVNEK